MRTPFESVDFTPMPEAEAAELKAKRLGQLALRNELERLQHRAQVRGQAHREGLVVLLDESSDQERAP